MAGTVTHLAIADKIYFILGNKAIKNLPLFFSGNIAPDAIHAKKDYQRADKKRSHLCEGIKSYGYGYPEISQLFKDRVNEFIEKYYMAAGEDKDLYLGYIVHLLVDEFYLFSAFERLENHLINNAANPDEPGFRIKLADAVSDDPQFYNADYIDFFKDTSSIINISANDYYFKQNVVDVLEAVWDYEVKDYIGVNEINTNKRWVINTFFKSEKTKSNDDREIAIKFINLAAENIIANLSGENDINKIF